ncbi:MAG: hypothetical protein Q8M03_07755 [Legionella sp.]|nr:hypothetical protein [Legionella sp.]
MLSNEDAQRAADYLRVKYGRRAEDMLADLQPFVREENVELTRILARIEVALRTKQLKH